MIKFDFMRGLKLIQNNVVTFAPYNEATIAMYQERNNNLRGSAREREETTTIFNATAEEVERYLLADVVASTAGVHMGAELRSSIGPDIGDLMAMVIKQQALIDKLMQQKEEGATVPAPGTTPDPVVPAPGTTPDPVVPVVPVAPPADTPAKSTKRQPINLTKNDDQAALDEALQNIE